MKHNEILKIYQYELSHNKNVLGLLVFGSVAKGTHNEESDIDLIVIYKDFPENYEFTNEYKEGIKLGLSKWSYDCLESNLGIVMYLIYTFANATILLDPEGKISALQETAKNYFVLHPLITKDWLEYSAMYEEEKKKFGVGKTPIQSVLNELEEKYSGGKIKRTFLL